MIKAAKYYLEKGISVIPTGTTKSPHRTISSWTQFQTRLMTTEEVERLFIGASGVATIGGMISGGRVHIDFDTKYDLTGTLYEDYCKCVNDIDSTIISKMVIVRTPSGGWHWVYKTDAPTIPSMKLAQRETTEEELEHNPNEKVKVLIETKGDKGYCLAPPSVGYSFVSEIKFPNKITKEEEEILLEVARMFDSVPQPTVQPPKRSKAYSDTEFIENPFEAFNKKGSTHDILVSHGWHFVSAKGERNYYKRPGETKSRISGDFHTGLNLFKAFSTSTQFDSGKGYTPVAVYCLLNHNNDWSKCAKDLLEKGFGTQRKIVPTKYANEIAKLKAKDSDRDEIIQAVREVGNISIEEAIEVITNYEKNQGANVKQFWDVTIGKDDKKKITILLNKFVRFINENFNIYRYKIINKDGEDSQGIFRYIRIDNNVISEIRMTEIKDLITDYVKGLEFVFDGIYRDALMEVVQQKTGVLFSDAQMEFLDYADVDILKDTPDTAYYPFKNTIAFVNRNGIHTMGYNELNGKVIWKDTIIQHNFEQNNDVHSFSFHRFISKIMGDDQERLEYFASCMGYILHGYKDELNPICIILGEEVADSKEGGGAGKGIVTQAISKIVNQTIINGKGFKADKPFAFQRVALDTQLIVVQDTDSRFDFESLFSKLTDGLTIEKKNKDELFLPYSESPKFLITTNYSIPNTSSAARRRQRLVEFSNFFSDKYTPYDFLGEYLFFGWTPDDWNKFYTIMFDYVCFYFQQGILKFNESDSSIEKRIVTAFTQDFFDFYKDLKHNFEYELVTCYNAFLTENSLLEKNYSKIRFSKGIDEACIAYKLKKTSRKDNVTRKTMFTISTTSEAPVHREDEEGINLPF